MSTWDERPASSAILMNSSIRNKILSRNPSVIAPTNTVVSNTPVDNKIYFAEVVGTFRDIYFLDDPLEVAIDFNFINPDDFFFVFKRPNKAEVNYRYIGKNIYLNSSDANTYLSEIDGTTILNNPGIFYTRYSVSQFLKYGAIAINKNTHAIKLVTPWVECSSSARDTKGVTAVSTLQSIFSLLYNMGSIIRSGSLPLSHPPISFGDGFYVTDRPILGYRAMMSWGQRSLADIVGIGSQGSYDCVLESTIGGSFNMGMASPRNVDINLLYSAFPGVVYVDTYEELNELLDKDNSEIESLVNVFDPDSPYTPGTGGGKPSSTGGGGGNFGIDPTTGQPVQSDDVEVSLPSSGSFEGQVSNAGLFVHYAMNANMLEVVGDWLWATDLGLIIAKEVLSILYGSPIESAISLMSYPFSVTNLPGVVTNQQELYWGAHGAGFNATAITNPYATIDWGTIQLTEFWGNFLDYAPHTKLELYLPWCTGFVPIDPNECLPGTLKVVTNIELAKGTCLHNVIGNDGRVIATHTGICGKQLPLTALDTSGKALSMVTAAISTAVAGAAGAAANRAGEIAGANYMAGARQLGLTPSQAVTGAHVVRQEAMAPHQRIQGRARNMALAGSAAATRTPSSVQRNGSFSGSTAGLGVQYPYLIISRPTQSVPKQYGHHYGYPSNIYTSLLTLRGYTEIGEIHLTGFTCTEDELTEIDSLLKSGVIL